MSCSPVNITTPPGPSGPAIQGFGSPSAPGASNNSFTPTTTIFPEDLLGIVDLLQFITPAGTLKSSLSINYGKDLFDGLFSLLDKFTPFLMLYKYFLPVLNIIICIIEVLCALVSPFAVIAKMQRLFRVCIPQLIAIFPQFALIIMILSIINLLLQLITYIIDKVLELVTLLLNNITALLEAFQLADQQGVMAITNKIGLVICAFQNLFAIMVIFAVIIQVFQDILKVLTAIPPCSDSGSTDISDNTRCCAPPTCPAFIKNNESISANTGSLQYFNEAVEILAGVPSQLYPVVREESWQFYDVDQSYETAFSNITNAYDLPQGTTVIFFPSGTTYTAATPISQVPYLINLTLTYNPATWDRVDPKGIRPVQINNCIVVSPPVSYVTNFNNSTTALTTGVLELVGGMAFENDGTTPILINGVQATLNTLISQPNPDVVMSPNDLLNDGYLFSDLTYTWIIQHEILFAQSLITLGCIPSVGFDRDFVNTVFGGNAGTNLAQLNALVLPDVAGAQQCLTTALAALAANVSTEGVANFQASTMACLNTLQNTSLVAANSLLNLGYDPYQSSFSVSPTPQFTSQNITVQVVLNETNGQNIASGLDATLAAGIAANISAIITFGSIGAFAYDGVQFFNAEITSPSAGSGTIEIAYNGVPISTATLPTNLNTPPSISITTLPYTFVYSPFSTSGNVQTGTGDTTGKPRLNDGV
jgi:hypothetical protein